jgi:hypothetical protein
MMRWLIRWAVILAVLFVVVPQLWGTPMQVAAISVFLFWKYFRGKARRA